MWGYMIYQHAMSVTVTCALILAAILLFAWIIVRAVRTDLNKPNKN